MKQIANRKAFLRVGLVVLAAALLLACATTSYKNGQLETKHTVYKVTPPPSDAWRIIDSPDADLAFWHDKNDAFILVNSSCEEFRDTPARALANQLFIGIEDKKFIEQKQVTLDGRLAWFSIVTGQLDGAPVKVAAYTLVKNYCTYDLSYSAPLGFFDAEYTTFEKLVRRFTVVRRKRN